jgi:hypothetical protein
MYLNEEIVLVADCMMFQGSNAMQTTAEFPSNGLKC